MLIRSQFSSTTDVNLKVRELCLRLKHPAHFNSDFFRLLTKKICVEHLEWTLREIP